MTLADESPRPSLGIPRPTRRVSQPHHIAPQRTLTRQWRETVGSDAIAATIIWALIAGLRSRSVLGTSLESGPSGSQKSRSAAANLERTFVSQTKHNLGIKYCTEVMNGKVRGSHDRPSAQFAASYRALQQLRASDARRALAQVASWKLSWEPVSS